MDRSSYVILVVDDDDLVRNTISTLVKTFGYTTLEAESGKRALDIIEEQKVDLVLTDVVMPGMDGLELLKIIWESDSDIDVIVVTGFANQTNYVDAVAAGAIDFLKKPLAQKELDVKLARAFRERCLMRELELVAGEDEATGLLNYTAFTGNFSKELERAARQNNPLHLAMIEVNAQDDNLISELAEIVKQSIRVEIDKAFRYSENEIAVALPETTADQAAEIMQRLLIAALERGMRGATSLAIGLVACVKHETASCDEAVAQVIKKVQKATTDSRADGGGSVVCWV